MRKIVAIGGGENGKFAPYDTKLIDMEIVKLTEKEKPNFLFLAHSWNSSIEVQDDYFQTMKKIYGEIFNCNCRDLKSNELKDIEVVKEKIEWADIIYEGGGDTLSMIKLWKDTGFDKILYEAWNKDKVICGISAGAVCWFKSCNSDSLTVENEKNSFINLDCLNWFPLHLTPHANEAGRRESTKKQLKENGLVGIMLSNRIALEIVDNKYRLVIDDSNNDKKPYGIKAYWKNNTFIEEKINISSNFENINKLLNK